ncbi:MAG: hypothetical protein KKE20_02405 [Nanoarchaeota archaeon]|nr:hypothetical protein [Nanoarchaeota archaeon]
MRDWKQVYDILHRIKDIHEAVCWRYGIENNSFHIKEIDEYCRRLSERELYSLVEECNRIKKSA